MWTSFYVSVLTVLITLLFSMPGAYAVARLRFRGQAAFEPVDPADLHGADDRAGAADLHRVLDDGAAEHHPRHRDDLPGHHDPGRALHAAGLFPRLPAEIEEAGLMDGLNRLQVIWKITLPLSLPALASVSLYVFMIAWNEFLLAFMLLDDPSKFTLTRGDRLAQFLGDPAPAPDGGRGDRDVRFL
jgi:multiple sugar transport system permease protein